MIEDEKIIEMFFERSEQGIRELDIKYGKVCHKLSYNIVNSRQDAEECVNDAYLGAWNAIPPANPHPLLTYCIQDISWTASMVYKLLTSYVYTGATVGHKRKSGGVGSRKTISQKKEEWIIVEGMHEAIVSKEEFELAQAVIRGGEKNPKRNLRYYPLKGLVCCGNCKRALTRRKLRNEGGYFYQCTYSTHDRDTECPVGERYSEAWIEDTAYKAIGQMLTLVEKKAVKEHEISKRRKSAITECADAIRDLQKQSEQLKGVKLRLYEKYTLTSITKAEYLKRKAEVDAKIAENEEAIRQGHERMQELDSEHPCSDERLDKVVGDFQKCEGLTYVYQSGSQVHQSKKADTPDAE